MPCPPDSEREALFYKGKSNTSTFSLFFVQYLNNGKAYKAGKGNYMDKNFDFKASEPSIYKVWETSGEFEPKSGEKFVVPLPPPNVTGVLHLGHALNGALQDSLVRYYRMSGRAALWIPGTDHAGIATQHVVERKLREEGKDPKAMSREDFLEKAWQVQRQHHDIITSQLRALGASFDWSRERFTLDPKMSKAVAFTFKTLYDKGLIYRAQYLVNWCPSCQTALSDDEVEHSNEKSALYYVPYAIEGESGASITIATTRPETIFADQAIAVSPSDERYKGLVGKKAIIPLTNGIAVPIIADHHSRPEFGTGAVKITPAHDMNDYKVGQRHDLKIVNILTEDGHLSKNVPAQFAGLTVLEARKAVVSALKEQGLISREEPLTHSVGHCYRCNAMIEPRISTQWFVKMKTLAENALSSLESGDIVFYPERWGNTYRHWMETIQDWCISRQLIWGHQIPAWHCQRCAHITVSLETPGKCEQCGSDNLVQETDVLDTWFSSWLWPFASLGWPEKTEDLERFFPSSVLVTAYDIIFFWVARMVMASKELMGVAPFKEIYITPLVRDSQGRKMSKSLGNGIDPLSIIDKYGADALKFTLIYLSTQSQDISIGEDTFSLGGKFVNKIWNAARLILSLTDESAASPADLAEDKLPAVTVWAFSAFNKALARVKEGYEKFRFDEIGHALYELFWDEICAWYLEAAKVLLREGEPADKIVVQSSLLALLEAFLRLAHPSLSFVTQALYDKLPKNFRQAQLGELPAATIPIPFSLPQNAERQFKAFEAFKLFIQKARSVRKQLGLSASDTLRAVVICSSDLSFESFLTLIPPFAGVLDLSFRKEDSQSQSSEMSFPIPFEGMPDLFGYIYCERSEKVESALEKMKKELDKSVQALASIEKRLSSEAFTSKAPQEVVAKERQKADEISMKIASLRPFFEKES